MWLLPKILAGDILSWKPAKFDHKLVTNNCVQCHRTITKDDRPLPANSHPSSMYNQLDCALCHSNSDNSKKWIDTTFSHRTHTPAPTACATCHEIKRPLTHKTNPRVAGMGTSDCKGCHTSATDWTQSVAFDHDSAKPLTCISCHQTSIPQGQTKHPTINQNYSKLDCVLCHTYDSTTTPKAWSKIVFDQRAHSPAPTSCKNCHNTSDQNSLPVNGSHASGARSTSDCASCHTFDSVKKWKNLSKFRHTLLSNSETCSSCHTPTVTILTSKPATHIATTFDCKSCHTSDAWKPATYTHAVSDTNCISCHNGTIATAKPATHNLSGQCSACHTQTNWTKSFTTTYAHTNTMIPKSGTRSHPSVTSCTKCHSSTNDNVNWTYTTTTSKATIIPKGTCAGCHLDKYNKQHGTLSATSTSPNCLSCHQHSSYSW
jgi:hypothetical protein